MINKKAYINVPAYRNINRSFICAIDVDGVVAYQYKTGAYNSESFIEFLVNNIVPYFELHPNKVLIMDNAKIHKSASVIEFLESKMIFHKFLVPYSPKLKPIEEFFAMIKARFAAIRISHPIFTIEECIDQNFSESSNFATQCVGFFNNMRVWLEKARRREIFI